MIQLYTLYKSTRPNKKYDIYVLNPLTDRVVKIAFGDSRYEDYTMHKDEERRRQYWKRHKNDELNNPLTPGFWAAYVLWGPYTDINKNLTYTLRLMKKQTPAYFESTYKFT